MRILSRYVARSFLGVFAVTLAVLTFVMCVMVLFRISDFLAAGGRWQTILRIFLAGLPSALGFSIPVSILTSALLTFGRLSAYGEITAMKSCGVGMLQIIRMPVLVAAVMSGLCLYLNAVVVPNGYHMRRQALISLGMETPLQLIEEGRPIRDFPGFTIYVGRRQDATLQDIVIHQQRPDGSFRNIRAKRGTVAQIPGTTRLRIDLYEVRIDPFADDRPGAGHAMRFPLVIDLMRAQPDGKAVKKKSDQTQGELSAMIRNTAAVYPELDPPALAQLRMGLIVEYHKRIVLALSCVAFVLLGIPLATRTHRKESSVGLGMSLVLVFGFYLFVIVAESLSKYPALHPYAIVWLPVVLSFTLGGYMIRRCD